eukprot:4110720-Pyramimonas_sp.AAC.4
MASRGTPLPNLLTIGRSNVLACATCTNPGECPTPERPTAPSFSPVPFRNLAYYRHEQLPPLKDLGFEIIPEIASEWQFISELNLYANHLMVL